MSSALQRLAASGAPLTAAGLVERLGLWEVETRAERPRVVAAMIGSLDGRATVQGRAGGLGSPADRDVLRELRTAADALLVGPGTLIAERYATILDPPQQQRRVDRGLPPEPLVATISRSLDPRLADVPLFSEPDTRIEIFTEIGTEPPGMGENVTVTRLTPGPLGARACLLHMLAEHGARLVVTEGGPTLLRGLFAENLVDDLVLTLAPLLVAGDALAILNGAVLDPPARLRLNEVLRAEDHVFLHYSAGA